MRISDWSSDVCSSDLETSYGRITGSYRVLDALYTLAFSHPRRALFFAGELAQLFALAKDEPQLDILALTDSYAGALGMDRFMPALYRNWPKDGDAHGRHNHHDHKHDVCDQTGTAKRGEKGLQSGCNSVEQDT